MKLFYEVLLWLTRLELAIARSTGCRRERIAQLTHDIQDYERCLFWIRWAP